VGLAPASWCAPSLRRLGWQVAWLPCILLGLFPTHADAWSVSGGPSRSPPCPCAVRWHVPHELRVPFKDGLASPPKWSCCAAALAPTVFLRVSHLRSPGDATASSSDLPLLGLGPGCSPPFQRLLHAVATSRSGDTPGWMTRDARRASRPWLLSPGMVPPTSDVPLLPFLPASADSTCSSAGLLHPATGSGVHCVLATPRDSVIPSPAFLGVATSVPWSLTKPPSFPSRELGGDSLRSHSVVAAAGVATSASTAWDRSPGSCLCRV